jgi:hypothetical protein
MVNGPTLAIRIRETFTAKMLPEPGCEPEVRIDFERIAQRIVVLVVGTVVRDADRQSVGPARDGARCCRDPATVDVALV